MKFRGSMMVIALLCATATSAYDKASKEYPAHTLDEVVALSGEHPAGVKVTVEFPIARVGFTNSGRVYLDSMYDYHDPRTVNVNVFPHAARQLNLTSNADLVGKTLTVRGLARRERIACDNAGDCPFGTGDGYLHRFVTNILVLEADNAQIKDSADE